MTSFLQVNITRIVVSTIQTALETVFPSSNHGWNLERPANLFPSLVRTQLPAGRRCLQAHAFLPFMLLCGTEEKGDGDDELGYAVWEPGADRRCRRARSRNVCRPGPRANFCCSASYYVLLYLVLVVLAQLAARPCPPLRRQRGPRDGTKVTADGLSSVVPYHGPSREDRPQKVA